MNIIKRSLFLKLFLPVAVLMLVSASVMWFIVPQLVKENATTNAATAAELTVKQFKVLRGYYVKNVVKKVLAGSDMTVAINHVDDPNAIPLPATMIHDLSKYMKKEGTHLQLYSAYPFPNRQDRKLDSFAKGAWTYLQKNPDGKFVQTAELNGKQMVRVAIADKMVAESCVSCHNSHPDTPKNDWKLGDVRGVLEVSTDIDEQLIQGEIMSNKIVKLLAIALLIISIVFFFTYRLSVGDQVKRALEVTSDIAEGRLNNVITDPGNDEIGQLLRSIRSMQSDLNNVLTNVVNTSDDIASTSSQISATAQNLSQATSEQAASVEETSASIEQMGASITQNSENAQITDDIATDSSKSAEEGADAVSQTVTAMKQIAKKIILSKISPTRLICWH
ncbi:MAG: DUF3365 domain-containing protein [Sneathiella sp.]|nr:DUF3365 domain-containing protein [Sneathiella sp.]